MGELLHSAKAGARTAPAAVAAAGRGRSAGGFTLVEILIVVVILGILASVVVPQFSGASHAAKENTLRDELRYLRTQIVVYKAQHNDRLPGIAGGDFALQMTQFSNLAGETSGIRTATHKYGPYLKVMPRNSVNTLDTVQISNATPLTGDGSHGWVYNPSTGEIIADLAGNDTGGDPYASY